MKQFQFNSYAKLNLFLDILGQRADGYHTLCMVNTRISLHDRITIQFIASNDVLIMVDHPSVPSDERNTAHKAAVCFLEQSRQDTGVRIVIEKQIPVEGGLGGGSGNAATVLQALNQLFDYPLSDEELRHIGEGIGADVPFFLAKGCCLLGGVGEQVLESYFWDEETIPCYAVLCSPQESVSTKMAYQLWDESVSKIHRSPQELITALKEKRFDRLPDYLFNSFEPVIYEAYPSIQNVYNIFCEISPTKPLLSGSGSNLFSLTIDLKDAKRVVQELKKNGLKASCWECLF